MYNMCEMIMQSHMNIEKNIEIVILQYCFIVS